MNVNTDMHLYWCPIRQEAEMELGWGIWNFLCALAVIGGGAGLMHEKKTGRSAGWYGGLVLIVLGVWTLFYVVQLAFNQPFLPEDVPLQFTDITEGIGRYFLNIGAWVTQNVGA